MAQEPAAVSVVSGAEQAARQGLALPAAVIVRADDAGGSPIEGVTVVFAPADGDGTADPATAPTNAGGRAVTSWTLGDRAGVQSLVASVAGGGPSTQLSATALTPEQATDSLRVVEGDGQSGIQGRALRWAVVVLALDGRGKPVPGVRVAFAPADGDGRADPDTVATDAEGRVGTSWTLGDRAGAQRLVASVAVAGGPSAQLSATALTPEEATDSLRLVQGDGQRGVREATLPAPVVFAALDADGRPVPGVEVSFAPNRRSGRADPRSAITDAFGRARTSWTLGASLGRQVLTATAADVSAQATATALTPEDAADSLRVVEGDGQRGVREATLPAPVVFAVLDAGGRGVPGAEVSFSTASGNGRADPGSATTDARGRAQTSWTLGAPLGAQTLTATAAGLSAQATAEATDRPLPPRVSVAAAHLVQAAQNSAGSVPLVAGRPARLRVFAVADYSATVRFRPLALFYRGATVVDSVRLDSGAVSSTMDEGAEDQSFDATIPGSVVQPGLEMVVELDPGGEVAVADGSVTRFPATGRADVLVHALPSFPLTLVPVHFATTGNTGTNAAVTARAQDMAGADTEGIISYARNVLPIGGITVTARQAYVTWADTLPDSPTDVLLSELSAVRQADGSSEYYHGLFSRPSVAADLDDWNATEGIAYRPGYAGVTVTHRTNGSAASARFVAGTLAHELGHNINLRHAPCGGPSGLDPDFPHSDGSIGTYGYGFSDAFVSGLVSPETPDVMSYCWPRWISDYHFKKAMDYRRSLASRQGPVPVAGGKTLLLWGSVHDGELRLEPAFASDGPVKLPESAGPYRLEGLAANGESLFRLAFSPDPVDHGGGGGFVFAMPFEEAWTGALDRIELTGPEGATAVDRAAGERAAMLIDRATGQVRSIVRNWSGVLPAAFGARSTVVIRRGLPR